MKTTSLSLQKNNPPVKYFIGVLSGTSMDSINAVLIDFTKKHNFIIATSKYPLKKTLVEQLLTIIRSQQCSLEKLGTIDHLIGRLFAKAINKLLKKVSIDPKKIAAIGSHGQTIWHAPFNKYPFTMQIGDPNIICAHTKIVTIADFRRKDLAYGGQGAPLAPLFHEAVFRSELKNRAIINLGGIANITILPKNHKKPIFGFDIGPGNCLMDEWVQLKFPLLNLKYDKNGKLASQGTCVKRLLACCLHDDYFTKPYPKSTGREYFNLSWLQKKIALSHCLKYDNKDILATLLDLTINIISTELQKIKYIDEVYICGGGANNLTLLKQLKSQLTCSVSTTTTLGIHQEWVEAALFAWLAKQTLQKKPVNLSSITGAKSKAILGGVYFPP